LLEIFTEEGIGTQIVEKKSEFATPPVTS